MSKQEQTSSFKFLSLDRLKAIETDLAGIRVDKPARELTDPSSLIADAINKDIKSLESAEGRFKEAGLSVCANAAIKAKQSFGFFPDDVIEALASNQSDLNVKAKALSVMDNPQNYSHLVDEIFDEIDSLNDIDVLSPLSQLTATLVSIDSRLDDSFFEEDKLEAVKKVLDLSFKQSEPFYLCNLAVDCDSSFLEPASELCFQTGDALNSMRLLSDSNGWPKYAELKEGQSFIEKLSYTAIGGLSLDGLSIMASRTTNRTINNIVLKSLLLQSKSTSMDNRLSVYLDSLNLPIEKDVVEDVHATLVKRGHKMNTLNAQKSLLGLIKKYPHKTEPYEDWMLERTIEQAERHYDEIKSCIKDLTLIDITEASLFIKDKGSDDVTDISLAGMTNEQSMRDALAIAISNLNNSYEVEIGFRDTTTPLLQKVIKTQIEKSLDGRVNYLDKILTLPVDKVASELDSRGFIQDKIVFDATTTNKDNNAQYRDLIWESLNKDGMPDTPINRINPILVVKILDDPLANKKSYKLKDYRFFDEFLEDVKNDDNLDFNHIEVQMQDGFLSKSFDDDFKRFIEDRDSIAVYNLNKHFTHTVNQFIDSKDLEPATKSKLKEFLNTSSDVELNTEFFELNRNKVKI